MNESAAKEAKTQLSALCAACLDFRSKPENQNGLFAWCVEHLCKWCPAPKAAPEAGRPKE
jgi:hypothetical protein